MAERHPFFFFLFVTVLGGTISIVVAERYGGDLERYLPSGGLMSHLAVVATTWVLTHHLVFVGGCAVGIASLGGLIRKDEGKIFAALAAGVAEGSTSCSVRACT